ncbi:MAG: DUF1840 domain-containing protein [Betaproteobacteria bacterium]
MIYEFRSRATGSVVMTGKIAERMLGIIGKPAGPQGIITVAQLPDALEHLRAAIADERRARDEARQASREASRTATDAGHRPASGDHDEDDTARGDAIPLESRALPLIEMFERSLAAKRDITWGV